MKVCHRVATCFDKLDVMFRGFVHIACITKWLHLTFRAAPRSFGRNLVRGRNRRKSNENGHSPYIFVEVTGRMLVRRWAHRSTLVISSTADAMPDRKTRMRPVSSNAPSLCVDAAIPIRHRRRYRVGYQLRHFLFSRLLCEGWWGSGYRTTIVFFTVRC